nr:SAM-dependent chlorinase/fluorinase [Gammaproteobacteria bacterium]
PAQASATFHGRDLFAPVAARVVRGERVPGRRVEAGARVRADWPEHLERIVYIDHYGNAMSGVLARAVDETSVVEVHGHRLRRARTFAEVRLGEGMWYENANGLAEIAVNQGRADRDLGLHVGTPITLSRP